MRNIEFVPKAFKEYQHWIETARKMALRIGDLIKDILRNPFEGVGKPEALKHQFKACWNRTSPGLYGYRHIHSYIFLLLSLLLIEYLPAYTFILKLDPLTIIHETAMTKFSLISHSAMKILSW